MAMLDAAEAAGVERFVLVSTDKAVRPIERHGRQQADRRDARCRHARRETGRPYVSVRFGNVLGLERQRRADLPGAAGERRAADDHPSRHDPLLHDHPRGGLADPGRGRSRPQRRPVRARHGRAGARSWTSRATSSASPGRDPDSQPMEIVGLRPGEKLHEELFYDVEQVEPTTSRQGAAGGRRPPPPASIREDVRQLLELASGDDDDVLRISLLGYVRAHGEPMSAADLVQEPEAPRRRRQSSRCPSTVPTVS